MHVVRTNIGIHPLVAAHTIDLVDMDPAVAAGNVAIEENRNSMAQAAVFNGKCIGAAGVYWLGGKTFKAWVNTTPELKAHALYFHKLVKARLAEFLLTHEWERIEASVDPANDAVYKWIQRLGFEPEACNESGWVTFRMLRSES